MIKTSSSRPESEEAERDCLPYAAHGREVEPAAAGRSEVFEVDVRGEAERFDRFVETVRAANSDAWIPGESELPCAVRGS